MNSLQLFLVAAGCSLISWASSEGIDTRGYLPAVATVSQPRTSYYSSYYKPFYNQYQQTYPSYTSSYYPQYTTGFIGGYQQQALGQHFNGGTSLGAHFSGGTSLGQQHLTSGTSLGISGVGGCYPNVNLDLINGIKPKVEVIDTVYDTTGGYVYGKKK